MRMTKKKFFLDWLNNLNADKISLNQFYVYGRKIGLVQDIRIKEFLLWLIANEVLEWDKNSNEILNINRENLEKLTLKEGFV